jgi:hypothetical protein
LNSQHAVKATAKKIAKSMVGKSMGDAQASVLRGYCAEAGTTGPGLTTGGVGPGRGETG